MQRAPLKVRETMGTRKHVNEELLTAKTERVFALLHPPRAIRAWWGAARAVVLAREGGVWAAAWGDNEDDPEYITAALIETFDPPRRLVLTDFKYHSKSGPLPFQAQLATELRRGLMAHFCAWCKTAFRRIGSPTRFMRAVK
jgi:uncharacterized protein YndB with AHSA1/START domain